jgi:hypothetical protein
MQRQDRVPAETEPEGSDLFNGSQRARRVILEEQHMTIVESRSELNSIQQVLAAWMIVATIGLAAIFLL